MLQNLHDSQQTILVIDAPPPLPSVTATATQGASTTVLISPKPAPIGTLAGFLIFIRATTEECLSSYPPSIELLRLYVDPAFHGTGVAAALVFNAEEVARKEGWEGMWLVVHG